MCVYLLASLEIKREGHITKAYKGTKGISFRN